MNRQVGIIIPTYNSSKWLKESLPRLTSYRVVVVDSSSSDETVKVAQQAGVEVVTINKGDFNHGLTREMARHYLGCEIVIMMTPDAVLATSLQPLIDPLINGTASVAYARQIPRHTASRYEKAYRSYNYPDSSHIRSERDLSKWGAYLPFCSNSCAGYLSSALDEIGGFPRVPLGEDTLVCSRLLARGHSVAYVAECEVVHSHALSLGQEWKRMYATGQMRGEYAADFQRFGSLSKRGTRWLLRYPTGLVRTAVKYLAFKAGWSQAARRLR